MAVGQEPEQLGALQGGTALILDVVGRDAQAALIGEYVKRRPCPGDVLLVGGSADVHGPPEFVLGKFTGRMLAAVNGMLLDMLAAIARQDYVDRRRRQAGTAKAKAAGRYRGRPEDRQRNNGIAAMLRAGSPWQQIEGAFGCSRPTIAKVKKRLAEPPTAGV